MKIILTSKEKREFLLCMLANGGLGELVAGGSKFDYDGNDYRRRRKNGDTYEDVLVRMILNGDDVMLDGKRIDMANFNLVPVGLVMAWKQEQDDVWTGYEVLQWLAFGEVVYG